MVVKSAAALTVTAENGSKKSYVIKVKRAKDPNYKSSSNNKLSSLNAEGFRISPLFKADNTNYVVWLPYETKTIKVSGKPVDSKASGVEIIGGDNLLAGQDNEIKVICTAENGDKKEYVVIAKRAAAHDGSVDEKPAVTTTANETSTTKSPLDDTNANSKPASSGTPVWLTLLLILLGVGIGFGGGLFTSRKLRS
ncbi:MAG TPA: cadherin-like beta sandwich domain-containing protein [Clostridia bacterium]|nr:cadherin-like beta sandwich domain-containing protein [Clostridia bacterium]